MKKNTKILTKYKWELIEAASKVNKIEKPKGKVFKMKDGTLIKVREI